MIEILLGMGHKCKKQYYTVLGERFLEYLVMDLPLSSGSNDTESRSNWREYVGSIVLHHLLQLHFLIMTKYPGKKLYTCLLYSLVLQFQAAQAFQGTQAL